MSAEIEEQPHCLKSSRVQDFRNTSFLVSLACAAFGVDEVLSFRTDNWTKGRRDFRTLIYTLGQ